MKKASLSAISAAFLAACLPGQNEQQYEIPDSSNVCDTVNLADGKIDGAAEFERLFDCINDVGSLAELEPMIDDLASTTNPATGEVYLEDLVMLTNAALAD